jgi:hypothetical protein
MVVEKAFFINAYKLKRSNKPTPEVEILSYGLYSGWDKTGKSLPKLVKMTESIEAALDIEFGMIVEIIKGKGRFLTYRIDHPPFTDANGNVEPPFIGEYQVRANPYRFFLGDTIWAPVEDKRGEWTLSVYFEDEMVAQKTLSLL